MEEREAVVGELRRTEAALVEAVTGVSAERLEAAPEGRWSIRQCAEHLALCEAELYETIVKMLAAPAQVGRRPNLSDDWVWRYGTDREHAKGEAGPSLQPSNLWPDLGAALACFRERRARTIELALSTPEDLRAHLDERGDMDAWQYLLITATHTSRHILQIDEMKA
jgi:DinB superfamily